MKRTMTNEPVEIYLTEDNPSAVCETTEAIKEEKIFTYISVVEDGEAVLAYPRKEGEYGDATHSNLILRKKNGIEVLKEVKEDPVLRRIPVVFLTISKQEQNILKTYDLHKNCNVTKPIEFDLFSYVVKSIEEFWFSTFMLPHTSVK